MSDRVTLCNHIELDLTYTNYNRGKQPCRIWIPEMNQKPTHASRSNRNKSNGNNVWHGIHDVVDDGNSGDERLFELTAADLQQTKFSNRMSIQQQDSNDYSVFANDRSVSGALTFEPEDPEDSSRKVRSLRSEFDSLPRRQESAVSTPGSIHYAVTKKMDASGKGSRLARASRNAVSWWVSTIEKWGFLVILMWLVLCGVGFWKTPAFFGSTSDTSTSQFSSPGVTADEVLGESFYFQYKSLVTTVLVTRTDHGAFNPPLNGTDIQGFCDKLIDGLMDQSMSTYGLSLVRAETPFLSYMVNISVVDGNLTAGEPFVYQTPAPRTYFSQDNATVLIILRAQPDPAYQDDDDDDTPFGAPMKWMHGVLNTVAEEYKSTLSVSYTGNNEMWDSVQAGIEKDLLLGDGISIPSAMLLLCYTLQSFRYVFVPIFTIAGSTMLSFCILLPVAQHMSMASVAPNLVMVLSIALSVDYNLFIISRIREEFLAGRELPIAVAIALLTAGNTVVVSGLTLVFCTLGLLLVPLDLLSSLGIVAAVTVSCAMFVNLTLTPTLILTFPRYFKKAMTEGIFCRGLKKGKYAINSSDEYEQEQFLNSGPISESDASTNTLNFNLELLAANEIGDNPSKRHRKGGWYKFGAWITKSWHPYAIVAVIAVACGLLVKPAIDFTRVGGIRCFAPIDTAVYETFQNQLIPQFGGGRVFPYTLVVQGDAATDIVSTAVGVLQNGILVNGQSLVDPASVLSVLANCIPGLDGSTRATPSNGTATVGIVSPGGVEVLPPETCAATYAYYVNDTANATIIEFNLKVDQWGNEGTAWLQQARLVLQNLSASKGGDVRFFLAQGAAVDIDLTNNVYDHFPVAVGFIIGVVLLLMTVAFRSVVIALKAVVSIGMTLSIVYGIARFVYQDGIFNASGFRGFAKSDGLCWLPPILTFPMLIGFGLDYHIFLISRVVEFRLNRMSNRESVLLGLSKTGRIITFAGVIMAVAFFGLLPAYEHQLSQLSFIVVIAVLTDTFLIRGVIIPCMMVLIGKYNWWPRRMPAVDSAAFGEWGII